MLKNTHKLKLFFCIFLHVSVCVALQSVTHEILLQDFMKYSDALDKTISFFDNHISLMDPDFMIAILFADVHLQKALQVPYNENMAGMRARMEKSFQNCRKLSTDLKSRIEDMVTQKKFPNPILFENEKDWLENLPLLSDAVPTNEKLDSQWRETNFTAYCELIKDFAAGVPTPLLSNTCIYQIQDNPVFRKGLFALCGYNDRCVKVLRAGSDYGYHLTHRLLHLLSANYGRNCYLISPEDDAILIRKFCTRIFAEAKFIAMNEYSHAVDLILEQIALCSLAGYPQFLKKSWLDDILRYQSDSGCFILPRDDTEIIESNIIVPQCGSHFSSVAAASLAPGIRYIFETLQSLYN